MKRALLLVCLLASPATAQVNSNFNPYNPYVNLTNRGPVSFRPYVSLDRLNIQRQNRVTSSGYFAANASSSAAANPNRRPAGFQYYPNYRLLNSPQYGSRGSGYTAAKAKQPLPLTAPLPVEYQCDPYLDDDGCLSEIAGW